MVFMYIAFVGFVPLARQLSKSICLSTGFIFSQPETIALLVERSIAAVLFPYCFFNVLIKFAYLYFITAIFEYNKEYHVVDMVIS